jgi:hypothetical protein
MKRQRNPYRKRHLYVVKNYKIKPSTIATFYIAFGISFAITLCILISIWSIK